MKKRDLIASAALLIAVSAHPAKAAKPGVAGASPDDAAKCVSLITSMQVAAVKQQHDLAIQLAKNAVSTETNSGKKLEMAKAVKVLSAKGEPQFEQASAVLDFEAAGMKFGKNPSADNLSALVKKGFVISLAATDLSETSKMCRNAPSDTIQLYTIYNGIAHTGIISDKDMNTLQTLTDKSTDTGVKSQSHVLGGAIELNRPSTKQQGNQRQP